MFECREELRKPSSGEPLTAETLRGDKGCVNTKLKYKNMLSFKSKPWKNANTFIPFKYSKKKDDNSFSVVQMVECTNLKATPADVGSTIYLLRTRNPLSLKN